jgi:DNA invertase Pin-like site-specific DNA recombinase
MPYSARLRRPAICHGRGGHRAVGRRRAGTAGLISVWLLVKSNSITIIPAERPALKRLLDIKARKVQIVAVYKVDRLTRSLADFAEIVNVLDADDASFVSVTQQFNTTTSMGRMPPNMLLSFAQFEREIAGARIRDKIAASKKRGMWMGGNVPLGYDRQTANLSSMSLRKRPSG